MQINSMKNVLLIGSELGKGGAERSISLLSYYLQENYNVTLCILSGTNRERFYPTCDDVIFVDPPNHTGIVGKVKAWRYRLSKLKEIKAQKNIDVSISFLEGPDYVNVLTRGKEKIVLSIRGSKLHDKVIAGTMGNVRKKILIPWLYNKADEIVCVANALADELHHYFGISRDKLRTIYNFYEIDNIQAKAAVPLVAAEQRIYSKPVIISSGRLHIAKEFDKLIQVFASVKKEIDARLMILGDGEMKQELIHLCTALNLSVCDWQKDGYKEADVFLMGFQNNAFKYYQHSSLFALSSSWEGFPNVLAEALICKLPVVSTDCHTGPREILDVKGLKEIATLVPLRLDMGSLMPLLQQPSSEVLQWWANEIIYWLRQPSLPQHYFTELTSRFTKDAMLRQWCAVIDK